MLISNIRIKPTNQIPESSNSNFLFPQRRHVSHLILTQKSRFYTVYLEKNLLKLLLDKELYINTEASRSKEAVSLLASTPSSAE